MINSWALNGHRWGAPVLFSTKCPSWPVCLAHSFALECPAISFFSKLVGVAFAHKIHHSLFLPILPNDFVKSRSIPLYFVIGNFLFYFVYDFSIGFVIFVFKLAPIRWGI